ncbi:phage portal protein [Cohnella sp. WQ 127256]|uniref:phage portal protein n=1 Tax=Cohnella sp. WQ 127256 TaxID=2938790 RepID=UPI00211829A1|nr:phage portal protein [Cohnella sp. WQ 127256]
MGVFRRHQQNIKDSVSDNLLQVLGINPAAVDKNRLSEITYFTCLKLLSESIGKLPLKLYQETETGSIKANGHNVYPITKTRPNPYTTAFTFWASVEMNRNHHGNAFVYIDMNKGKVKGLYILPSQSVQIWIDDAGLIGNDNAVWYTYTDKSGKQYKLTHNQVMHFKTSTSLDGITGLSVADCLKTNIENAQSGQGYINTYFRSGLTAGGLLQYTGDIEPKAREKMQQQFTEMATGVKNAGKILPIPLGFSFQQIKTTMVESQFLELNKHTALQISAAFGIKPSMLNDYSSSTFSSVEAQQTAFWVDTLQPIITQYEQEIGYKLLTSREQQQGYYFKFNVDALMRTTFKERWDAYAIAINNGGMTPNEVREKEDLPLRPEGDQLIANGNYIPLADVGKQYPAKGGE